MALALNGRGLRAQALENLEKGLAIDPRDVESQRLKALLLNETGRSALAEEIYQSLFHSTGSPAIAIPLAQILIKETRLEEALELLDKISPALPKELRPYDLLAQALTELGRFEEAAANWSLAAVYAPNKDTLIHNRAVSEISAGRFHVAEKLLRTEIEEGRNVASCFLLLSTAQTFTIIAPLSCYSDLFDVLLLNVLGQRALAQTLVIIFGGWNR